MVTSYIFQVFSPCYLVYVYGAVFCCHFRGPARDLPNPGSRPGVFARRLLNRRRSFTCMLVSPSLVIRGLQMRPRKKLRISIERCLIKPRTPLPRRLIKEVFIYEFRKCNQHQNQMDCARSNNSNWLANRCLLHLKWLVFSWVSSFLGHAAEDSWRCWGFRSEE